MSLNSAYTAFILIIIVFLGFVNTGCKNDNSESTGFLQNSSSNNHPSCNQLSDSYHSYEEAILAIKDAKFKFSDRLGTGQSSWIQDAMYYSCDGNDGYLIIVTSKKEYIHKNVPISEWNSFKNSSSKGSFYTNNIKGRY